MGFAEGAGRSISLSARITCILVGGLVLAQLLTSTIWFESRRRHMLEIPARVFATRVADTARILAARPAAERETLIATLQEPGFSLQQVARLPPQHPAEPDLHRTAPLLQQVIELHLGRPAQIRVIAAKLLDDQGHPAKSWAMMSAREPVGAFTVALRLAPGDPWLLATGREDENGADFDRVGTIIDYILRIYIARIAIVGLLTWLAVRLALKPLDRMAHAAQALGRDINSPPMDSSGPVEVRRAARAFNAMQRRLIASIEERTRFLAAVSHDLRSPITRMRLRAEMLTVEAEKPGFRKDLAEMEGMVEATLSFMKGEAEDEPVEVVDLDSMLAGLAADMRMQGKAVEVAGSSPGGISGSPQGLRRCLQNLLDNAVRYGDSANMRVSSDAEGLIIAVRDKGPGIPDDRLDLVFEPFYRQEDSRNIASGGVGLGLSIARSVAQAHGGQLWLRNHPEGGLEALLSLPRGARAETFPHKEALNPIAQHE
jgi:signal transduction histidine kinase